MRNKISLIFIVIFGFNTSLLAQNDARAKAILSGVSKKYKSYSVVKAGFTFVIDNPQANIKQSQAGTLYVQSKLNKFKVSLPQQEIICDGKTQWTYLKEDKEVQVSNVSTDGDAINPAQLFTIYEKGFKYVYTGEIKQSSIVYQQIELAPLSTKSYSKIKLLVDKAKKQLAVVTIFDKNGSKYIYTVSSFTPNVKVAESVFSFNKANHPGVEVVDLR